ncbi:2-amino-4-hydroxy-6-hydroxymethyldihydropteridine diphosphokinase [Vibrio sp. ZSDZ34]|jgi:2-amino-4-hydroxy-6-hydroxymethyldihydropteridine diphosphokinase|uniref:2-amino-4-hydroxy-6-hydroxymethyldihydropteridine diphosphokinase n=1 Tax=Vibrio gelatinilyticus TaxID=2893468 RepID=A0A9X1WEZ6_9VIBR|nr:2-amino-4-hydroxy-6-hydroxymethyldihydropteridine diphosphokinase [Vibrio gelatinilyticus]MCJ2377993.1 2-amino-4-hydroxy-6-hydroxymethyldihydropteridine diphosphokinase [Vibrio gelatinilyticus]
MITAYIGVGSNLEREKHIQAAHQELKRLADCVEPSPVYSCESVGFSGHEFYNMVFRIETELSLSELNAALKAIEIRWGRAVDATKFQNRTLDLDILLFGQLISHDKPKLPRDDIFKYPFVVQPLFDLTPDLLIPEDGRSVRAIRENMPECTELKRITFQF